MFKKIMILSVVLSIFTSGCAHITETVKALWGSSTKALEEARADALTRTYACQYQECFDAVLALAYQDDEWLEPPEEAAEDEQEQEGEEELEVKKSKPSGHFAVFIKNFKKKHIVVMGVPGNVDTTEVGIFFNELVDSTVKLEVTSLSSSAKRTVSEIVFRELDMKFSAAN
ncbi:MAG: hypothetical protein A3C36_02145 [Omnitrophica WOR_2 bacterium RIFCSPHIGHO2_02_FULL_52_10]|nr:MAG: hypothetical protein A3C36_02145 [Omnitrophica WOR_2 bacterium RIFCSPHIGHO2_02_FULL_52_10]